MTKHIYQAACKQTYSVRWVVWFTSEGLSVWQIICWTQLTDSLLATQYISYNSQQSSRKLSEVCSCLVYLLTDCSVDVQFFFQIIIQTN